MFHVCHAPMDHGLLGRHHPVFHVYQGNTAPMRVYWDVSPVSLDSTPWMQQDQTAVWRATRPAIRGFLRSSVRCMTSQTGFSAWNVTHSHPTPIGQSTATMTVTRGFSSSMIRVYHAPPKNVLLDSRSRHALSMRISTVTCHAPTKPNHCLVQCGTRSVRGHVKRGTLQQH